MPSLRLSLARLLLATAILAAPLASPAQDAPRFASYTTSRLLVFPVQSVSGVADARPWLARYDSAFTGFIEDGGVGSGWAYPRDAVRYQRQNPTFLSDPAALGAQPLRGDRARAGTPVPEPMASRVRAFIAVADARFAIVPVAATVDSSTTPRTVQIRLAAVDGRLASIVSMTTVSATFDGDPAGAAIAAAREAARLFVVVSQ